MHSATAFFIECDEQFRVELKNPFFNFTVLVGEAVPKLTGSQSDQRVFGAGSFVVNDVHHRAVVHQHPDAVVRGVVGQEFLRVGAVGPESERILVFDARAAARHLPALRDLVEPPAAFGELSRRDALGLGLRHVVLFAVAQGEPGSDQ
ncbi:hypothetical protein ACFQT0_19900 [Hymenobacter humi]|uniref:Uncharacterized protein n=1 Tax=Hymenobacter humi TaxID=1411620 RepID=A0ABW2UAW8_9BACT